MTIVILGVGQREPVELKFDNRPTSDQLCALLASGLFNTLRVLVDGETVFFISGERLEEFGKLRWGLLS